MCLSVYSIKHLDKYLGGWWVSRSAWWITAISPSSALLAPPRARGGNHSFNKMPKSGFRGFHAPRSASVYQLVGAENEGEDSGEVVAIIDGLVRLHIRVARVPE